MELVRWRSRYIICYCLSSMGQSGCSDGWAFLKDSSSPSAVSIREMVGYIDMSTLNLQESKEWWKKERFTTSLYTQMINTPIQTNLAALYSWGTRSRSAIVTYRIVNRCWALHLRVMKIDLIHNSIQRWLTGEVCTSSPTLYFPAVVTSSFSRPVVYKIIISLHTHTYYEAQDISKTLLFPSLWKKSLINRGAATACCLLSIASR